MATKKKHSERAKRSNRHHNDMRNFWLYRMSSIVERGAAIRRHRSQAKGA